MRFAVYAWNRDAFEKLVDFLRRRGIKIIHEMPNINAVMVDMNPDMVGELYGTGLVRLVEASYPFVLT